MIGAIFELNEDKKKGKVICEDGKVRDFEKNFSSTDIKPFDEVNLEVIKDSEGIESYPITNIVLKKNELFPKKILDSHINTGKFMNFKNYFLKNKKNIIYYLIFLYSLVLTFVFSIFMIIDETDYGWKMLDSILYFICNIIFEIKEKDLISDKDWFHAELLLMSSTLFFSFLISLNIWFNLLKKEYKNLKKCLFQVDLMKALDGDLKNRFIESKNKYSKI